VRALAKNTRYGTLSGKVRAKIVKGGPLAPLSNDRPAEMFWKTPRILLRDEFLTPFRYYK